MNRFFVIIPFVTLVLFSTNSNSNTNQSNVEVKADISKPGDSEKVSRTIKLTQVDNMFLPSELTVREGETVRLVVKNGGNMKHEMLIG